MRTARNSNWLDLCLMAFYVQFLYVVCHFYHILVEIYIILSFSVFLRYCSLIATYVLFADIVKTFDASHWSFWINYLCSSCTFHVKNFINWGSWQKWLYVISFAKLVIFLKFYVIYFCFFCLHFAFWWLMIPAEKYSEMFFLWCGLI